MSEERMSLTHPVGMRGHRVLPQDRPRPVPILLGLIHMLPSSPTAGSPSTL
jgi:hypothetical protein